MDGQQTVPIETALRKLVGFYGNIQTDGEFSTGFFAQSAGGGEAMVHCRSLESDTVGAALFGDATGVREGDTVRSTRRFLEVPVGPQLLGRVVDPLGKLLDATALQCIAAAKCEALADQMFLERLCPKRPCRTRGSQSRG